MANPFRFAVVTSSEIEAGMVLNYLIKATNLRAERVYIDTRTDNPKSSPGPDSLDVENAPPRWQRVRWNLALSLRLRRHYAWRVLEKVTGCSQLGLLRLCERTSPYAFRKICGVALDPALASHGRLLYSIRDVADEHEIPLVFTSNVNSPDTVASLTELQPDVVIGIGTRILSKQVLNTARLGVLNGHSSLLPDYRGSTTEFWQLAAGEPVTGVTIHWMARRVDQGDICAQRSWAIPHGADHYLLRLMSIFYRLEIWAEVIRSLLTGTIPRSAQGPATTPTFRRPTFRQEFEFYCRGIRPDGLLWAKPCGKPERTSPLSAE
jgi:folate-dependent phosphoribosylglycinamide formyltransferase PurN